jgi:hypothetical protein
MRKLITGVDAEGRSCVLDASEVVPVDAGEDYGVSVARVYATSESPPPPRPTGFGPEVGVGLPPGLLRWNVVEHRPHEHHQGPVTSTTMHHKDTVDLVYVAAGAAEVVLQDGAHPIGAGDFVMLAGVDHAWRAGPDGCRLVVVSVGTPPPGQAS